MYNISFKFQKNVSILASCTLFTLLDIPTLNPNHSISLEMRGSYSHETT